MRGKLWTRLVVVAGLATAGVRNGAIASKNLLLAASKTLARLPNQKYVRGHALNHCQSLVC